jgi:hypothetical protein
MEPQQWFVLCQGKSQFLKIPHVQVDVANDGW